MGAAKPGTAGRRRQEKTTLFGLVSFQPRLVIVLVFLTITVAAVGIRIARDAGVRKVDALVRTAQRAFAVPQREGAARHDPGEVEERVREWTGANIVLPRDEERIAYTGVTREKIGLRDAAAVRLTFSGRSYLILVVRKDVLGGAGSPGSLFSQSGFLSGERDGKSFVVWTREGVSYLLVTDEDLEHAFDLVRRYFT